MFLCSDGILEQSIGSCNSFSTSDHHANNLGLIYHLHCFASPQNFVRAVYNFINPFPGSLGWDMIYDLFGSIMNTAILHFVAFVGCLARGNKVPRVLRILTDCVM